MVPASVTLVSPLVANQRAPRMTIRSRVADALVSAMSEKHLQVSDMLVPFKWSAVVDSLRSFGGQLLLSTGRRCLMTAIEVGGVA
mgnify:CR=1 FL=1|jgi:hypothetical protein